MDGRPAREFLAALGTYLGTNAAFICMGSPQRHRPSVTAVFKTALRDAKACNLALAARRRVGHIGRIGDVAEWLKAAVC
jgi:hypothetical protein